MCMTCAIKINVTFQKGSIQKLQKSVYEAGAIMSVDK
jgi:hypothetical protein